MLQSRERPTMSRVVIEQQIIKQNRTVPREQDNRRESTFDLLARPQTATNHINHKKLEQFSKSVMRVTRIAKTDTLLCTAPHRTTQHLRVEQQSFRLLRLDRES